MKLPISFKKKYLLFTFAVCKPSVFHVLSLPSSPMDRGAPGTRCPAPGTRCPAPGARAGRAVARPCPCHTETGRTLQSPVPLAFLNHDTK